MATYTTTKALGAYNLVSGGFYDDGESYFQGIVGNGVNATQTTSDYYSSGSNTTAVFTYDMSFSNLPSDMTNISCSLSVNGHPENPDQNNEYMCVQLKSGNTNLTEQYNFKSSGTKSNTTYTLNWNTTPSRSQLQNLKLECTLGYYGGAINGATLTLTYTSSTAPSSSTHITYFGYSSKAKKVSKIYFGYGNKAKKVKKGYIGIGGAAKLFYTAEEPLTYTYTGDYTTSTVGTYTVLKITGSGTLTFSRDCSVDIWLCGGGANGSYYGGGGGKKSSVSNQSFTGQTSYTVTVGSRGGTSSVKQGSTTICTASGGSGKTGGSGGGGYGGNTTGGSGQGGTESTYYPFNSSSYSSYPYCDGGGGGGYITGFYQTFTRYDGGDGGTQGSDGSSASKRTSGTTAYYGNGGGYYGGNGGNAKGSGTSGYSASNGYDASGYGSGGGGGGYYYYEYETNGSRYTAYGSGGYGYQGIVFIRFTTTSS